MFIVKVPGINGLGKTKGCERAGNAILEALKDEISSNEEGKPIEFNKLDLEEIHLDNSNLELTNKLIYENSFETFEEHPKTIFLRTVPIDGASVAAPSTSPRQAPDCS